MRVQHRLDLGWVDILSKADDQFLGSANAYQRWRSHRFPTLLLAVHYWKCVPLLSGVPTFAAIFARDGKSFMYAVASRGDVTIYRQPWTNGKTIGAPQMALKVPFVFPLADNGPSNTYDFSKDLSTIVHARPGGHADLYLLSQK